MQEFSSGYSKNYEYDLAVVGSGSGGLSAAITAAKQGLKVILIDKNGYAGGLASSGIPFLGFLDMKKRPVVGGFATKFVDELVKCGASLGVRHCPKHLSVVVTKPDEVKIAVAKMCSENGVKLMLHSYLVDVKLEDNKISEIICDCAGERFKVKAKIFVDATGDGVLSKLAGAPYMKGTAGENLQPASVLYTIGGVDKEKFLKWVEENPENLSDSYSMEYLNERPDYVFVTLGHLWNKYKDTEWPFKGIWAMILINRLNDSEVMLNGPRMPATDSTDSESITYAETEGANQSLQFVEFLRKYVGGFENAFLSHINEHIGVRESRRVEGVKTLTIDMVSKGEIPEDAVALGAYPVDIHSSKDFTSKFIHVENPYGIPYLTTVAKTIDNLMLSGRCISVDREAFGSTRVMGTCLAMGEAVGYGASIAIKECILPKNVDVNKIRAKIEANGGILKI
ncbi:MAG: FAD-dependent oxidoreductase [Ruminococcaceae bacterium]|nr:FAD-dependent oxidoreductase [Oscillospiraceae bacterium]